MFTRGLRFFSSQIKKIDKILIANRGEIACRVIKTARKLGIKTVAVYSDVDANSLHVRMADESVCIGPAPSSESYLNIKEIMRAVKDSGAQAVHPGYGFLSENYKFCKELEGAGVEFIGPSYNSIHLMGDKIESKRIAKEAGVNTIPGFEGVVPDVATAKKVAESIGYPVMIKASAGGGGKGMRIAWNAGEIEENFRIAADESKRSFGDDRLLIEKFIEQPRHIEIQLIGDKHGNIVYLPERECSIQRRNQKVIEEAPSVAVDADLRKRMGEQAVQLARKVGYFSAGTVEFLLDAKKNFYFLEMNTRLQVEHPITEYITGLDLVELMIQVAEGKPLKITQNDVKIKGHAIECRIYAEDPKSYLPSIGRLVKYREPRDLAKQNRCDTGIVEGSEISIYYDPLICKLSTFHRERETALRFMKKSLDTYIIHGVTHNIPLLREIITNPKFVDGSKISTKFLEEEYPHGFDGHKLTESERTILIHTAVKIHCKRNDLSHCKTYYVKLADGEKYDKYSVWGAHRINDKDTPWIEVEWDGIDPIIETSERYKCSVEIELVKINDLGYDFKFMGTVYTVKVLDELEYEYEKWMKPVEKADLSTHLLSPMPGQILALPVKEGELVETGAPLITLEAMKMQNILKAQRRAKITKINAQVGQKVAADETLMEFEFI